jgi:hypothetical protein
LGEPNLGEIVYEQKTVTIALLVHMHPKILSAQIYSPLILFDYSIYPKKVGED